MPPGYGYGRANAWQAVGSGLHSIGRRLTVQKIEDQRREDRQVEQQTQERFLRLQERREPGMMSATEAARTLPLADASQLPSDFGSAAATHRVDPVYAAPDPIRVPLDPNESTAPPSPGQETVEPPTGPAIEYQPRAPQTTALGNVYDPRRAREEAVIGTVLTQRELMKFQPQPGPTAPVPGTPEHLQMVEDQADARNRSAANFRAPPSGGAAGRLPGVTPGTFTSIMEFYGVKDGEGDDARLTIPPWLQNDPARMDQAIQAIRSGDMSQMPREPGSGPAPVQWDVMTPHPNRPGPTGGPFPDPGSGRLIPVTQYQYEQAVIRAGEDFAKRTYVVR